MRVPGWPVPPEAMEPRRWSEPFNDERFAFQVKWDGIRVLVWRGGPVGGSGDDGSVRAVTRKGHRCGETYPELTALPIEPAAIYDGEMVVTRGGLPSFPAALRRHRARDPHTVARLMRSHPAHYHVFDLLWCDGRDLRGEPWEARQARLREALGPARGPIAPVASWSGERGVALFEAAREQALEGVVAKRRDSRYVPGKASDAWRKVKVWRTRLAVVGGYLPGPEGLGSLLLGAYEDDPGARRPALRWIGRAGSGLSAAERGQLKRFLDAHRRATTPFVAAGGREGAGGGAAGAGRGAGAALGGGAAVWAEPLLLARVRYQEWTPDLQLRAPVVVDFDAGEPAACRLEDWEGAADGHRD